ncbi:helix-turn-helix transcriptional regulator [Bacillus pseudomycoides]|uniref:helix-turn-helix domain-containing protein n=1 Tax=Bacillus pseudomycoides TaxID=64104 RepID=UPI002E201069|nr:helix-turn-helix transcriptional regulator [Bacillus pseudomycoides]
MTFGDKLKQLRGKRTQGDIATILEISRATYSHLENNRIEPSMTVLNAIADLFCVTTDYLLGRSQDPRLTESEDKITNEMAKKLEKLIAELGDADQDKALEHLEMFVQYQKAKK